MSTSQAEITALDERLVRFAKGREGALDPIGLSHARRMRERLEALPESARGVLAARIGATLDRIAERTKATTERAGKRIEALGARGAETAELRERLARSDARGIERSYRSHLRLGREPRRRDPRLEARLTSLARSAGVSVDDRAPIDLFALAEKLYRKAATHASADVLLDRVGRSLAIDAGRYHTDSVIAATMLAMRSLSPTYLAAQLARLELAAEAQRFLRAFEPLPEPPSSKPEKRGKRSPKAPRATKR